jgi:hypothetical protein
VAKSLSRVRGARGRDRFIAEHPPGSVGNDGTARPAIGGTISKVQIERDGEPDARQRRPRSGPSALSLLLALALSAL